MTVNRNFLGGGGVQNNKPSVRGVRIFSGTALSVGEFEGVHRIKP